MARLTHLPRARDQFSAILEARWRMFAHSLRTTKGKMELISRILMGGFAVTAGVGGAFGFAAGAYAFISRDFIEGLAILLWGIMVFWQLFPVMSTAFTGSVDSTFLVRFPLSYRSYYLIHLIDGLIGPASLIPCLWLLGLTVGIAFAAPALLPWAVLVLSIFAVTNLLLSRMILSWVERWMAQRRTREIFSLVFFFLIFAVQFIAPTMERVKPTSSSEAKHVLRQISVVQKSLPPGMAAESIASAGRHEFAHSALYFGALCAYGTAFLMLLSVRLRAQYRGENLGEGKRKEEVVDRRLKPGWELFGWPAPVVAVFEKEIRYLSRNGQMLLALFSPILVLLLFRLQSDRGNPLMRTADLAYPVGATLAVLSVMNMFQNSFGADGGGLQLLYSAPVTFRQIVLAKNLASAAVFVVELAVISTALSVMGRIPAADIVVPTMVAAIFAVVAEATIGNLLSFFFPKKIEPGKFNRQQASQVSVLTAMGSMAAIFFVCGLTIVLCRKFANVWVALGILSVLTCMAAIAYVQVLNRVDQLAMRRREQLLSEICRN